MSWPFHTSACDAAYCYHSASPSTCWQTPWWDEPCVTLLKKPIKWGNLDLFKWHVHFLSFDRTHGGQAGKCKFHSPPHPTHTNMLGPSTLSHMIIVALPSNSSWSLHYSSRLHLTQCVQMEDLQIIPGDYCQVQGRVCVCSWGHKYSLNSLLMTFLVIDFALFCLIFVLVKVESAAFHRKGTRERYVNAAEANS